MARVLNKPLIVILGSTGSGKSKLSLEIALRFNGEIINADAMQIYKGLNIITNKVCDKDLSLCQHHLIGLLSPIDSNFTVIDFQEMALNTINDIHSRGKVPVVVGGTNYYIESILFNTLLPDKMVESMKYEKCKSHSLSSSDSLDGDHSNNKIDNPLVKESSIEDENTRTRDTKAFEDMYSSTSSPELHRKLSLLDPEFASRLHPNNRRKILRALQVCERHGTTVSGLYSIQHGSDSRCGISGELRFPNPCVLFTTCEQSVLDQRLDDRVDSMIERGMLDELKQFFIDYHLYRPIHNSKAYTQGIFQSIGFKEFHNYLLLPEEERLSDKGKLLFSEGVKMMKIATRRYSRYQKKWISKRFLTDRSRIQPPVYGLDATNLDSWKADVYFPAQAIVDAYLQGNMSPIEPLPVNKVYKEKLERNTCEVCDGQVFTTLSTWESHLASRRHKKRLQRQKHTENVPPSNKNTKCWFL